MPDDQRTGECGRKIEIPREQHDSRIRADPIQVCFDERQQQDGCKLPRSQFVHDRLVAQRERIGERDVIGLVAEIDPVVEPRIYTQRHRQQDQQTHEIEPLIDTITRHCALNHDPGHRSVQFDAGASLKTSEPRWSARTPPSGGRKSRCPIEYAVRTFSGVAG